MRFWQTMFCTAAFLPFGLEDACAQYHSLPETIKINDNNNRYKPAYWQNFAQQFKNMPELDRQTLKSIKKICTSKSALYPTASSDPENWVNRIDYINMGSTRNEMAADIANKKDNAASVRFTFASTNDHWKPEITHGKNCSHYRLMVEQLGFKNLVLYKENKSSTVFHDGTPQTSEEIKHQVKQFLPLPAEPVRMPKNHYHAINKITYQL